MSAYLPNRALPAALMAAAASALDGCWTAPVSSTQPGGEPRVIQDAVAVESFKNAAIVLSVDPDARIVVLLDPADSSKIVYRAGARSSTLGRIKAGDRVRATVVEELTVFVSRDGRPPRRSGNANDLKTDAKVLRVDPS